MITWISVSFGLNTEVKTPYNVYSYSDLSEKLLYLKPGYIATRHAV